MYYLLEIHVNTPNGVTETQLSKVVPGDKHPPDYYVRYIRDAVEVIQANEKKFNYYDDLVNDQYAHLGENIFLINQMKQHMPWNTISVRSIQLHSVIESDKLL